MLTTLTLVFLTARNDTSGALLAQKRRDRFGHLPCLLDKAARFACTIDFPLRCRAGASLPCLHCDPRFPASTMRLRIRDGRLVFERMPEAALVALFLKKSCIRSAVFAIALPGGRAILWAFLGTSRFLHSARIGVFLFAGKTCELKPNYLGLRRSMQEQASTINFSGNAG